MFYVYLALGFAVFGTGIFLAPGWFKVLWAVGCVALAVALPMFLEKVLDPLNIRRITLYLSASGATDIEVEPFPSHYGARYNRDGARYHARCTVKRGKVAVVEREQKASPR